MENIITTPVSSSIPTSIPQHCFDGCKSLTQLSIENRNYKLQGNKLFLSKLYLKGSFHGKGLGQLALSILVDIAKARKVDNIYLTVNKGNVKGIKAYERFGFIKTDSIVTDIGNGFVMDDYVYTYNIVK